MPLSAAGEASCQRLAALAAAQAGAPGMVLVLAEHANGTYVSSSAAGRPM